MRTKTKCLICPKGCELYSEELGDCRVRQNIKGQIQCTTFNKPYTLNIDPVEKKPLYHFHPGSPILSVGTAGCNLHCKSCQNWELSQSNLVSNPPVTAREIVAVATRNNCPSIAYTYAEPLVSYEYTFDCCREASEAGIKNVLVTAAYINPDPLQKICKYIDAANVDLKSFSDEFYRPICNAQLQPVLNALKTMKECGVFLEITNLLIPTLNDSTEETTRLCDWVVNNLGPDTPLHFSRFFPQHKLNHLPQTPKDTIENARSIALQSGLQYVYVGNMTSREGESTFCPGCRSLLIERNGYQVIQNKIKDEKCPECNYEIHGIWK